MLIDCTNIHIVQGGHHFLRQPYILILIAHLYAVLLITYRGNIGQVLCYAGTDGYAFSTFSIYQVLPKIIELWGLNVQTDVESKKTSRNRSADDHTLVSASLRTARHLHPRP